MLITRDANLRHLAGIGLLESIESHVHILLEGPGYLSLDLDMMQF